MTGETRIPSDEELTAFLDGEASAEESARLREVMARDQTVAARVAFLSRATLPFRESFEPLLGAAPDADLRRMLDGLASKPVEPSTQALSRRRLFGALAASVTVGVLGDRLWLALSDAGEEEWRWRAVVAQYMALYTPATFAGEAPDRQTQMAQLNVINQRLGLSLTPESVAIAGAEFRWALPLVYDGRALAQITHLDPRTGPLALCILRRDGVPGDVRQEERQGLRLAFWSGRNHAVLLIGHATSPQLAAEANEARRRILV
jgi:anti-sigma factor RsiW